MTTQAIQTLPKGELFKVIDSKGKVGKAVYTYEGYCRSAKKYVGGNYHDISATRNFKKGQTVTTDFEF